MGILIALGFLPDEGPYPDSEQALFSALVDPEVSFALVSNMRQVRNAASMLRDRISRDAWLILNQLDSPFAELKSDANVDPEFLMSSLQERVTDSLIQLAAFGGLVMESMTRGDGWRFLDLGRRMERATQMAELLRHALPIATQERSSILSAILEIADSSMTYRSRYLTSLQADLVLDLLLVDEANPRAIGFQLNRISDHVERLPNSQVSIRRPREAQLALSLLTKVQLLDLSEMVPGEDGKETFSQYFDDLLDVLHELSATLSRAYFSHAMLSRPKQTGFTGGASENPSTQEGV